MLKKWILLGLVLQVIILGLFYRLFFEERTFIVRSSSSDKFSNPRKSAIYGKFQLRTVEINWNKVQRNSRPPGDEMHDRWIVLTTVNSPTEDVKKLAAIDGWRVVVVGDTKTPADWRYAVYDVFCWMDTIFVITFCKAESKTKFYGLICLK